MKAFLTANWINLINVTYTVHPELLLPYLPKGVEPDTIGGRAFVSVVAFEFTNMNVKGIKIPLCQGFPEVNLRTYVKHGDKRGVVFIREYVQNPMVALSGKLTYNENFSLGRVESCLQEGELLKMHYGLTCKGHTNTLDIEARNTPYMPTTGTTEDYFKELKYGFNSDFFGNTIVYDVEHPCWEVYPVTKYTIDFDFEALYGKQWAFLSKQEPHAVFFCKGSGVKVYPWKRLSPEIVYAPYGKMV